jgi:superfamily II DNA or RNA helicase
MPSHKLALPPPMWEQVFEDLCRDLWRRLWGDSGAHKHGRRGQSQNGVDIYGWSATHSRWEGVQCKLKGPGRRLKRSEIEIEARKALKFKGLSQLIVATTAPRDSATQEIVRSLSEEWQSKGYGFSISIFGWDDIVDELNNHQDLLWSYYQTIFRLENHESSDGGSAESPISVGAPRSEAGLGGNELLVEDLWIAKVRSAVDRQDYLGLEHALASAFANRKIELIGPTLAEFELYKLLLEIHRGKLANVRDRLVCLGNSTPPEVRLRTALGLLHLGYIDEATLLIDLESQETPPALRILSEAARIWASATSPTSIGAQISIERLDELVQHALSMTAPAALWLCFARLALKLGDLGRAESWLQQVDNTARASVDYLHVAALTYMQYVARQRLENPHRGLAEENRERLFQACAWLNEASVQSDRQSVATRSDLVRDLATAHELLAGAYEGAAREKQLVAAAESYQRAAGLDDGMSLLWARAGRCLLLVGRHREALRSYQSVPEDALDPIQRSDLAAALLLDSQPEAAARSIAEILNRDFAPWQALFNAAIILHLSGHSDAAARALEDARARAGRSSWRVEALRGIVYGTLGDSDRAEEAYRESVYKRGTLDLQLHQGFARAFIAGTMRNLKRLILEFRVYFRQHYAKDELLKNFEKRLSVAVDDYSGRLEELAKTDSRRSSLMSEAIQQSFETLNLFNHKFRQLQEIKGTRDRCSAEAVIDSISAIILGTDGRISEAVEGKVTSPTKPGRFDWRSLQSSAKRLLDDLPVETSLVIEDTVVLGGMAEVYSSESDALAHRLSIAARIFEINASTVLRCYQALSGRDSKGPVLHKIYQERAIKRVFGRMQGRAVLADDVGLGKTIEAGLILTEYRLRRLVRRCLILVPTIDLARQWERELGNKLGHDAPYPWRVGRYKPSAKQNTLSFDTWIVTYQAAIRHQAEYLASDWDMVIADEAHHLANRSSESYKFVKRLRGAHLLLLTATPIQHSIDDLFSLVSIVRPGLFASLRAFRAFFSDEALADQGQRETVVRLLSQVMIRNTLLAVADQAFTGRRVFKNILVQLNDAEFLFYEKVTNLVLALGKVARRGRLPMEYYAIAKMASSSARATFATVRGMARDSTPGNKGGRLIRQWYKELAPLLITMGTPAKTLVVKSILKEIAPRKALIFVEFRETALQLEERIGIPALHSKISQRKRETIIERFEKSDDQRAIVATKGLAEGLNLAFCSVLINYDLPWNPMRIEQRIGRIQRIGQHHPEVLIYSLAAAGTIEEEIRDALMRKVDLFQRVLGDIGLDLASVTDGRAITARLRAILKEATSLADLRERVRSFFSEVMPPSISGDPL